MIRHAKTFEDSTNKDEVSVGSKVLIHDEEFDEDFEYKIVGTAESNPLDGFISNESPVGAALLGKKVNDRVEVITPNGKMYFTVKGIN